MRSPNLLKTRHITIMDIIGWLKFIVDDADLYYSGPGLDSTILIGDNCVTSKSFV